MWNCLTEKVVTAPNIDCFKRRLDKYWKHEPVKCDHKQSLSTSNQEIIFFKEICGTRKMAEKAEPKLRWIESGSWPSNI